MENIISMVGFLLMMMSPFIGASIEMITKNEKIPMHAMFISFSAGLALLFAGLSGIDLITGIEKYATIGMLSAVCIGLYMVFVDQSKGE